MFFAAFLAAFPSSIVVPPSILEVDGTLLFVVILEVKNASAVKFWYVTLEFLCVNIIIGLDVTAPQMQTVPHRQTDG